VLVIAGDSSGLSKEKCNTYLHLRTCHGQRIPLCPTTWPCSNQPSAVGKSRTRQCTCDSFIEPPPNTDSNVELNAAVVTRFCNASHDGLWGVKGTSLRSEARYTLRSKVLMGFFVFSPSISWRLNITVGTFAIRDPRTCRRSLTGRQPSFRLLNIIEGLGHKLLLPR
jgi:hypothetical protein